MPYVNAITMLYNKLISCASVMGRAKFKIFLATLPFAKSFLSFKSYTTLFDSDNYCSQDGYNVFSRRIVDKLILR